MFYLINVCSSTLRGRHDSFHFTDANHESVVWRSVSKLPKDSELKTRRWWKKERTALLQIVYFTFLNFIKGVIRHAIAFHGGGFLPLVFRFMPKVPMVLPCYYFYLYSPKKGILLYPGPQSVHWILQFMCKSSCTFILEDFGMWSHGLWYLTWVNLPSLQ